VVLWRETENERLKRPSQGRRRFVPFLEALEDRSLPSVVPTLTFIDGTVGQALANQSSNITTNYQPTTTTTFTFGIAYWGSAIGFVSYSSRMVQLISPLFLRL